MPQQHPSLTQTAEHTVRPMPYPLGLEPISSPYSAMSSHTYSRYEHTYMYCSSRVRSLQDESSGSGTETKISKSPTHHVCVCAENEPTSICSVYAFTGISKMLAGEEDQPQHNLTDESLDRSGHTDLHTVLLFL